MADNKSREINASIKLEIDTSEVVSSMKAIQRLSKAITKAFKEYESMANTNDLSKFTDEELIKEIYKRDNTNLTLNLNEK